MLQNILGCCVQKMYTNLQLWVWIPLASAVALSLVQPCMHACRRNILQHHVFSSNGYVLLLLKLGWIIPLLFPFNCMSLLSRLEFTSVFLNFQNHALSTPPNQGRPYFSSLFFSASPCGHACSCITDWERGLFCGLPLLKGVTACADSAADTLEMNS